jgi:tetratricopeptide (TPR) repeat protein
MKMNARTRILSLVLVGFFALVTLGQAQTSAIAGDVKGPDGQAMKGVLVKITRKDIKGNYKVKTDKKGHYYYGGLPLGVYHVALEVDGKDVDSVDNVKTQLGDPIEISFNLKQQADRNAALQKAAETGTLSKDQERELSPEQKEALQKRAKEQAAAMAKNKELNDAFNGGKEAAAAKNWQGAADSFEKASQIDPSQNVIWANLADAYVNLAATKPVAEQPAIMEKGLNAYKKAIELKPDDAGYHNNYGLALARDKKFPEAQTELSKAAEIDPPNAGKYYFNLGALLVNSGHNQEAVEAFKKAIDANPNYAPAQYQYGVSLVSKATTTADGKVTPPPGTIEAFQKYLELEPNGPYADQAKAMLTTLTGSVETTYQNPNAAKKKKK